MADDMLWKPIEEAPPCGSIDVFYRNTTFDPPVEGILEEARLVGSFWLDPFGSGVPARYVKAWVFQREAYQARSARDGT